MYDIAIIGAGPAGATLARLIGRDYKVLLIDKRPFNSNTDSFKKPYSYTDKCCGGLLAPDAQKILGRLGLSIPQDVLVGPQIFVVRTIDLKNENNRPRRYNCSTHLAFIDAFEQYYQRFYININRGRFDRWLLKLIPNEVDTRFDCLYKAHNREKDGFKVNFTHQGRTYKEKAQVIIGADGANSLLRRNAFGLKNLPENYIAVQEWFETESPAPYFSAIFDSEITDFYAWTIPKENQLALGVALTPKDRVERKFEVLKDKLKNYGYRFEKSLRKEGAFIYRPKKTEHICTGENGIALIGEAAGFISPSSAEGLSYAMRSAVLAYESLRSGPENFNKFYNQACCGLRKNILLKNIKSPFMYHPWLRRMVMRSGIESVKLVNEIEGRATN